MKKHSLPNDYDDRVYAGWLGKCIGVHFGGPLEGWSYTKIRQNLGEVTNYLQQPGKVFKPDDDLIMPLIMMTVLAEKKSPDEISAEEIGETWQNLLSQERGGIWRGGYGISSEHTALINLFSGIKAPLSGSAKLNGTSISEQIGGQIFSDIWGLVLPCNPSAAADLSEKAASVSHDGEGINGGRYIAALVSNAFNRISAIENVKKSLEVLAENCEYVLMVKDIIQFQKTHPEKWRSAREYVEKAWGYERFSGAVPIIPNAAVIVLSLLYGENDFTKSIQIANMCGWDTDCNVGNVGAIMGVTVGLSGIPDYWRKPLNDFIVSSSVQGTNNIKDISSTAIYLANCGRRLRGEQVIVKLPHFHFDLPGSTHGFCTEKNRCRMINLQQSNEKSFDGKGSLKVSIDRLDHKGLAQVFVRTHFLMDELASNNYEASFSPCVYPGQSINVRLFYPAENIGGIMGSVYIRDRVENITYQEPGIELIPGQWNELHLKIPKLENICISEIGITLCSLLEEPWSGVLFIDTFDWAGTPDYFINFGRLSMNGKTAMGWTTYSGYWRIENNSYCGSGVNYNETYTCLPELTDYKLSAHLIPEVGYVHCLNIRVGGGLKSYAMGFVEENQIGILKKIDGNYQVIHKQHYQWNKNQKYKFEAGVQGNHLIFKVNGEQLISIEDLKMPYLSGQVGLSNGPKCSTRFTDFQIEPIEV